MSLYSLIIIIIIIIIYLLTYLLTHLLHGTESVLRSQPFFAASQEIPHIFMEPKGYLPYSQVPATCPYPELTLSSPHHPLQLPEDPYYYYHHHYLLYAGYLHIYSRDKQCP
jgi:hypothetical protein